MQTMTATEQRFGHARSEHGNVGKNLANNSLAVALEQLYPTPEVSDDDLDERYIKALRQQIWTDDADTIALAILKDRQQELRDELRIVDDSIVQIRMKQLRDADAQQP